MKIRVHPRKSVAAVCLLLVATLAAAQTPLTPSVTRLLVVTTPDWNAVDGTLTRYERWHGHWARVGKPIPVVVGKAGMAWDPKLARKGDNVVLTGPVKHEGDNRSPAGVFPVTRTFGFAATPTANYLELTASTECVDDANSRHYAQVVDRGKTAAVDWKSSEKMRSIDAYRWGAVVQYNMEPPVPGNGSCIFLHVWSGPGKGTAGCTAMPEKDMKALVRWLTAGALLVQMPEANYKGLQAAWGLPEVTSRQ